MASVHSVGHVVPSTAVVLLNHAPAGLLAASAMLCWILAADHPSAPPAAVPHPLLLHAFPCLLMLTLPHKQVPEQLAQVRVVGLVIEPQRPHILQHGRARQGRHRPNSHRRRASGAGYKAVQASITPLYHATAPGHWSCTGQPKRSSWRQPAHLEEDNKLGGEALAQHLGGRRHLLLADLFVPVDTTVATTAAQ